MESVLGRYRNLIVLVGVLFVQILGLAVQVKRTTDSESTSLIRVWAVRAVTPLEKALVWTQISSSNLWHNYVERPVSWFLSHEQGGQVDGYAAGGAIDTGMGGPRPSRPRETSLISPAIWSASTRCEKSTCR